MTGHARRDAQVHLESNLIKSEKMAAFSLTQKSTSQALQQGIKLASLSLQPGYLCAHVSLQFTGLLPWETLKLYFILLEYPTVLGFVEQYVL